MTEMTREDLQAQIDTLKKRLDTTLPDSKKAQTLNEQLGELERQMETLADAVELPFEITPHELYLRRLLTTMSRLELSGIDRKEAQNDTGTCLKLDAVYTALLTISSEQSERGMGMELEERSHRLSALDMLNRHERLVLLGDPGSGKSTFVKFVALCLSGALLRNEHINLTRLTAPLPSDRKDNDEEEAQHWQHGVMLPVLVILRDFAARGLPQPGEPATAMHLWTFIENDLAATMPEDYASVLYQHLQEHGGLILLDGLDEVPEADRRRVQMKQVAEDLTLMFPKCRLIITSRTYAYQQQDWKLSGFHEAVLAPFTRGQIRRFVKRWYDHIAEMRGMNHKNAQGQANLLERAILQSERLCSFAERPLLLTLMASLHAWRGGSLPEKRAELYAEATNLLLDWWERSKVVKNEQGETEVLQPSLTELLRVGKAPVERVLHTLAYQAHKGQPHLTGTADIPEKDLVYELMEICRNDKVNPLLLIDHLRDRAGLLVPRGVRVYCFPHRTFQEYLAACYLTSQDDYPDNVTELVFTDPERWREVVLLAAAGASNVAPMVWVLAEALCYQPPNDSASPSTEAWGALLAGQALTENTDLQKISPRNRAKARRIRTWLMAILAQQPPVGPAFSAVERALAGNILAQIGDPREGAGLRDDGLPDIAWCKVPAGTLVMGSDQKGIEAAKAFIEQSNLSDTLKSAYMNIFNDEAPHHTVFLSSYNTSRYPVTNAQYRSFVEAGGYTEKCKAYWTSEGWAWRNKENITAPEAYGGAFGLSNHPVVGVSWYEASAFCQWLTACLRACGALPDTDVIRLPTEAEWEKAARGADGRIFPWGNEITPEHANYGDTGLGVTSPVGCFPKGASPHGCEEMAGNVYEWCQDWFDGKYYESSPSENPTGPDTGSSRMLRGGSWGFSAADCRSAYRYDGHPGSRRGSVGFRLLRTPL